MSHGTDASELFDVDVDQFARTFPLIATHRFGRLQGRELVEAQALQDPADGCGRYPDFGGDLLACVALPAQSLDSGTCG